jgi:hypothetical protein
MKRLILMLVAVVLVACVPMQSTAFAQNVKPVEGRDAQYKQWYQDLEKCSGLKGDFNRLSFYTTTDHLHNGRTFDGYWEQQSNSIVLRKPWEREAVQHEMMHDLLQSTDHPLKYFKGVCGDLSRGEAF